MLYSEYIENLNKEWTGKQVRFEGQVYKVVRVDYNGCLLIDKPAQFTKDTAVTIAMVEEI